MGNKPSFGGKIKWRNILLWILYIDTMLNDIVNFSAINVSKLALFIFIICGNFAGDILSCSLRHALKNNMYFKHLVGFMILLLFIGFADDSMNVQSKLLVSIGLYFWYIVIMNSPIAITIATVTLIVILHILQEYIEDLKKTGEPTDFYVHLRNGIFLFSFLLSFFGFIVFVLMQGSKQQKYSVVEFLLGMRNRDCFIEKPM